MINRTQITVSFFFKADTTEDFTHEDNTCVADKEVDERLNTYFSLMWCMSWIQFVAFFLPAAFSM